MEHLPSNEKLSSKNVISESGRMVLEVVPQKLLKNIENNSRLEYVIHKPLPPEILINEKVIDSELDDLIKNNGQWMLYEEVVISPLTDKLKEEFKNFTYNGKHLIGLRGSVCSLDTIIATKDIKIKGLENILSEGTEKDSDNRTLISTINLDESDSKIHHRTTQWLQDGTVALRKKLIEIGEKENAKKLFPILIVYDLNKLTPGNNYEAFLPEDPLQAQQAILKIYILDYFDNNFPLND